MYGKRDAYFGSKKTGFKNSIWVELIAFDKEEKDFGVKEYIDTIGFVPDFISLLLSSVDFVHNHKSMDKEYVLPPYVCSYGGHPENDLRKRQEWTNIDLKNLIAEMQKHGIKVFVSFFDWIPDKDSLFIKEHPEMLAEGWDPNWQSISMIKRFKNKEYYEDFFLEKTLTMMKDYGFDGIQIADGISSPRTSIWFGDFSEDILEQANIKVPEGETPQSYIRTYKRKEWVEFFRKRYDSFLNKIIKGFKDNNYIVMVNSTWTRDPFESLYRYGTDYLSAENAGADILVVEDTASNLAILGKDDTANYEYSYEERKLIHYEFLANLMSICAHTNIDILPIFPIWDNQEQYNVVHHMPTAMQRAAVADFTHFCFKNKKLTPITGGPHFCLGDALSKNDWDYIRLCIDNGYTNNPVMTEGATFIWSRSRMESELQEFIDHGICHSARYLALLMRAGAQIACIADISKIPDISGDIVVSNYDLMSNEERAMIDEYSAGRVIKAGIKSETDTSKVWTPEVGAFTWPLSFQEIPDDYIANIAAEINNNVNAEFVTGEKECTLTEIRTGDNTSKLIIDNNEYYYVLPVVKTKRKIKSIKIITKPTGYASAITDNSFRVRIAGRGCDVVEISYED